LQKLSELMTSKILGVLQNEIEESDSKTQGNDKALRISMEALKAKLKKSNEDKQSSPFMDSFYGK